MATGFGTTEAHDSDLNRLYWYLRKQHLSCEVEVCQRTFNYNWEAHAYSINREAQRGAVIMFVGHSYGVGWGLKRFAKYMHECGRSIDEAYLIDPVIRPFQYLLPVNAILAFTRIGNFYVPANVKRFYSWRQVNDSPYGRWTLPVSEDTTRIHSMCYGSQSMLAKHSQREEERYHDPVVTHSSIDGLESVHREIAGRVAALLRRAA